MRILAHIKKKKKNPKKFKARIGQCKICLLSLLVFHKLTKKLQVTLTLACARRRISSCRFEKQQPEKRLRAQATLTHANRKF